MWIRKTLLLLFFLLLSSACWSLSLQEKTELTLLLNRYDSNEQSLLDQQKLSRVNLLKARGTIENSRQTILNLKLSLTNSQQETKKQSQTLMNMEESIQTLQNSYDRQQLQIKIMKYIIIGLAGVSVSELVYIGISNI